MSPTETLAEWREKKEREAASRVDVGRRPVPIASMQPPADPYGLGRINYDEPTLAEFSERVYTDILAITEKMEDTDDELKNSVMEQGIAAAERLDALGDLIAQLAVGQAKCRQEVNNLQVEFAAQHKRTNAVEAASIERTRCLNRTVNTLQDKVDDLEGGEAEPAHAKAQPETIKTRYVESAAHRSDAAYLRAVADSVVAGHPGRAYRLNEIANRLDPEGKQ